MIAELIEEYKLTLKATRKQKKEIEEKIAALKASFEDDDVSEWVHQLRQDKSIINSWISNLEYALEWMQSGKQPGAKRGIERRAAYERNRPFDPILMQKFFRSEENVYSWDREEKESLISAEDRERIEEALHTLSPIEKEIYLMVRGRSFTWGKAAKELKITKSRVQGALLRADAKIMKHVATLKGAEKE